MKDDKTKSPYEILVGMPEPEFFRSFFNSEKQAAVHEIRAKARKGLFKACPYTILLKTFVFSPNHIKEVIYKRYSFPAYKSDICLSEPVEINLSLVRETTEEVLETGVEYEEIK